MLFLIEQYSIIFYPFFGKLLKKFLLNNLIMEIVGLKRNVQDDVSKLIAKVVGIMPRAFMKDLKYFIRDYQFFLLSRDATEDEAFEYYNRYEDTTVLFHTHLL